MCRYSIGKVTPQQSKGILTRGDFDPESAIKVRFPRKGSRMTPRHPLADFEWKDYCPIVFRYQRKFEKDACMYIHMNTISRGVYMYAYTTSHVVCMHTPCLMICVCMCVYV